MRDNYDRPTSTRVHLHWTGSHKIKIFSHHRDVNGSNDIGLGPSRSHYRPWDIAIGRIDSHDTGVVRCVTSVPHVQSVFHIAYTAIGFHEGCRYPDDHTCAGTGTFGTHSTRDPVEVLEPLSHESLVQMPRLPHMSIRIRLLYHLRQIVLIVHIFFGLCHGIFE